MAAKDLAAPRLEIQILGIGDIPLYNEDLESISVPGGGYAAAPPSESSGRVPVRAPESMVVCTDDSRAEAVERT